MQESEAGIALQHILTDHTLKADAVTTKKYPSVTIGTIVNSATGEAFATPLVADEETLADGAKPLGGTYQITVSIHMENQGDNYTEIPRSFTVDSESPNCAMGDVLPIVMKDGNKHVNGKITFSASSSDAHLGKTDTSNLLIWGTPTDGTEVDTKNKHLYTNQSTANNYKSDKIDTTQFKDGTELYFAHIDAETTDPDMKEGLNSVGINESFDLIGASLVTLKNETGDFDLEHVYYNERTSGDFVRWVKW